MQITDEMKAQLQKDAQIPHLPTDLTYECRMAVSGKGPRTFDWVDKPRRLVYDLCRKIEELEASQAALSGMAEPVAWAEHDGDQWYLYWPNTDGVYEHIRDHPSVHGDPPMPLYAAPATPPASGLREENRWQPIETAPADWSSILLFDATYENDWQKVFEGFFDDEEGIWRDRQCAPVKPTHWMPLPEPPALQTEGK